MERRQQATGYQYKVVVVIAIIIITFFICSFKRLVIPSTHAETVCAL